MRKIFYLKSCNTCQRILNTFSELQTIELQDIKSKPLTKQQFDVLKDLAGSGQALFSRRAKKYKEFGLKNEELSEKDFEYYILSDYTFLKRPVVVLDDEVFIGSEKKTLDLLRQKLGQ